MRVLFIHNRYTQAGGEDVAVEQEMRILTAHGHQVDLIRYQNEKAPASWLSKLQKAQQSIYNAHAARAVAEEIMRFKPDVIHVHNLFFVASPSVLYAAHAARVPVLMTIHNYRLLCANGLLLRNNKVCELCTDHIFPLAGIRYKCYHESAIESALVIAITGIHKVLNTWSNKVHKFIVLTAFAKQKFINSSLGAGTNKFALKPNFIDDPGAGNWPRKRSFVFVGRLAPEKGIDVLFSAFRSMPGEDLLILGDGPERTVLEAAHSGYTNIRFAGQQRKPEILQALRNAAALIFPSIWYEGLPFTIIEAFGTGTPVIASNLGAMSDLIRHGYNGLHFEVGNRQSLMDCIQSFNAEQFYYDNARQTYLDNYHPDIHYSSIMGIYEEAIGNIHGR